MAASIAAFLPVGQILDFSSGVASALSHLAVAQAIVIRVRFQPEDP